jgi:hypothetical protein
MRCPLPGSASRADVARGGNDAFRVQVEGVFDPAQHRAHGTDFCFPN